MDPPFIHESAVVDEGAELAEGVKIWHFVHVSQGARIGAGSSLGQNVFVARGVRIGRGVKIQNNVSLYEGVEIDDDVFLGPSCVFTNVINPRAFVQRKHAYRATYVGRGASIGANATIVCGTRIGEYAFVAAGATVTRDVQPYALVVGAPARHKGFMCSCGEKLSGTGSVRCAACGARYVVQGQSCAPAAGGDSESTQSQEGETMVAVPLLDLEAQNRALLPAYRAAFERVMQSGHFIMGPEVEALESELRESFGFKHALTVSSGTDALLLALMALGIGPGDEVVTSAFSFFATAGCVARVGARPVFVDIDPGTFNLDPSKLEAAISARTKAILPVHLFGQSADMSAIARVAVAHGLPLIEDAAQSLGASWSGQQVGRFGAFGCFSFFPSKNLGGFGDGGLLTTEDDTLAERARLLRTHGAKPKYFHKLVGGNFRLDALQAALLRVKLPELTAFTAARRRNAARYDEAFADLSQARKLCTPPGSPGHVYNQYVVRAPRRDGLREALTAAGIGSEIYYPRGLHLQECFGELGYRAGSMPETERAAAEVLAIPVFPELSEAQQRHVVSAVRAYFSD
jgi:dTDP-4-amino-4,6-dideoxygalactose transaminase/acetyltransferase-like isoleucine patch superfamily enzyme